MSIVLNLWSCRRRLSWCCRSERHWLYYHWFSSDRTGNRFYDRYRRSGHFWHSNRYHRCSRCLSNIANWCYRWYYRRISL